MDRKPIVMVVEDENLLLQAITKKLELSGITPVGCTSGQQGIDYLQNLEPLPDLIWLDYHLTDMDGLTFMSKLKEHEKLSNIPVVVVSNSASADNVFSMLGLGAKEYILKAESRLDEIIVKIKKFIEDING